jgi:hypothetical protein
MLDISHITISYTISYPKHHWAGQKAAGEHPLGCNNFICLRCGLSVGPLFQAQLPNDSCLVLASFDLDELGKDGSVQEGTGAAQFVAGQRIGPGTVKRVMTALHRRREEL